MAQLIVHLKSRVRYAMDPMAPSVRRSLEIMSGWVSAHTRKVLK
jgi:hypothetical protein